MTKKFQQYYAKNLRLYLQESSRSQNKDVNLFTSYNNENYSSLVTDKGRKAIYSG